MQHQLVSNVYCASHRMVISGLDVGCTAANCKAYCFCTVSVQAIQASPLTSHFYSYDRGFFVSLFARLKVKFFKRQAATVQASQVHWLGAFMQTNRLSRLPDRQVLSRMFEAVYARLRPDPDSHMKQQQRRCACKWLHRLHQVAFSFRCMV